MGSEYYNKNYYKATCPGSLMIMGEYAVLSGYNSIVAAIDKFLTVELYVSNNSNKQDIIYVSSDINKFNISSSDDIKTNYISTINNIETSFILDTNDISKIKNYKILEYFIKIILFYKNNLMNHKNKLGNQFGKIFKFKITSDINHNMGLGSSAALIGATVSVIEQYLNNNINKLNILKTGHKIIKYIQGSGSASDLAASLYGGVVLYNTNYTIQKISDYLPINIIYSGYKLPTKDAIQKVYNNKDDYNNIMQQISKLTDLAVDNIKNLKEDNNFDKLNNLKNLGELFNKSYLLQEQLGVSDHNLSKIIDYLNHQSNIYGSKISGSGLGDCVIGLGEYFSDPNCSYKIVDAGIVSTGLI